MSVSKEKYQEHTTTSYHKKISGLEAINALFLIHDFGDTCFSNANKTKQSFKCLGQNYFEN